jgi:hypothetical protein
MKHRKRRKTAIHTNRGKKYDYPTNWFLIIGVFFAIGLIIEMYLRLKKRK